MFTPVKEYVCIVILYLVSLASSSATRMAVISASSTDAKSLIIMIISSSICTTATVGIVRDVVWVPVSKRLAVRCFSVGPPVAIAEDFYNFIK